ncbi:hypothetical protein HUW62_14260 [Myxococcus sp. AM011]|uniref:hypothetical protein n=1 Tax=Myxococcus sp. AM011 TaxID=2745200 RepID=UPI001595EA1F|nr:hypothetical protein [Myxococcus sp. AM011]NVJ22383.1 hypothetical protein [Myxococcus sp. AM011]
MSTPNDEAALRPAPPPGATARSVLTVLLSVLVAFFPKCAMCWAAYFSMFGSVWLARTPYVEWLFPALLALSGVHLLLLWRKAPRRGYGPFVLSLLGLAVIVGARGQLEPVRWLLFLGMALMVLGSLLNGFSIRPTKVAVPGFTGRQGES